MTLFDPDPRIRWLFCLTHPDDELFIAGWIRQCVLNGCEVFLSWTHDTPIRQREAKAAATAFGVPWDRLFFHGGTDGSVCDEIPHLLPSIQSMVEQVKPDRIVCGAFEQGHLDHDATNYMVNQVFAGPICEVPFYHAYLSSIQTMTRFSDSAGQEVFHLNREARAFKRRLYRQYPSQNIYSVLWAYRAMRLLTLRPCDTLSPEHMRWMTHQDFLIPNHPEPLRSKVEQSERWQRWVRAMNVLS